MSDSIQGLLKQLAIALAKEDVGVDEAVAMLLDTGKAEPEQPSITGLTIKGHPVIPDGSVVRKTDSGRFYVGSHRVPKGLVVEVSPKGKKSKSKSRKSKAKGKGKKAKSTSETGWQPRNVYLASLPKAVVGVSPTVEHCYAVNAKAKKSFGPARVWIVGVGHTTYVYFVGWKKQSIWSAVSRLGGRFAKARRNAIQGNKYSTKHNSYAVHCWAFRDLQMTDQQILAALTLA